MNPNNGKNVEQKTYWTWICMANTKRRLHFWNKQAKNVNKKAGLFANWRFQREQAKADTKCI